MHIAFAASECVPFSKTGGLADVVGALPRALASAGHQVSVYVPRYRQTQLRAAPDRRRQHHRSLRRPLPLLFGRQRRKTSRGAVSILSIIHHFSTARRSTVLPTGDYPDNAERFALFSRAVLEASKILGVPQIFHCHDWQAALIPVLLRTQYAEDPAFSEVATVFTIHNMGYQGLFPPDTLPLLTLALGSVHHLEDGVFRQRELPEGRAGIFRLRYHGEQEI